MKEQLNKIKSKIINSKILKSKITAWIILALIICGQLGNIAYRAAFQKEGYHSDEIFVYGLANSFYSPFIEKDHIYSNAADYQNINQWLDGSVLRNYITVQENQRFRYDSVWYNQQQDRHPPLYYAIMHTICSFFPDTFTPVFGYAINFICFAVIQIFLFKLSRKILKSRWLALLVCLCWGFCSAAMNMTIFIRMYCMLAMWQIIFIYLHAKLADIVLNENPKNINRNLIIQFVSVTILGALTQHTFLAAAFFETVVFCIWLLLRKRIRIFLQYGFSILGGVIASILIFPATIPHLFSEGTAESSGSMFSKQIIISINYYFDECFSFQNLKPIVIITCLLIMIAAVIIFSIPVIFLFRDKIKPKEKFSEIKKTTKDKFSAFVSEIKSITPKKAFNKIISLNPVTFVSFIGLVTIILVVSYKILFVTMYSSINRYFFIIYPTAFFMGISFVYFLLSRLKKKKYIMTVLISLIFANIIINSRCSYLYKNSGDLETINDITAGNSVIVVEVDRDEDWLVNTLTTEMFDVGEVFMTNSNEYKEKSTIGEMNKVNRNNELYLMICENAVYQEGDIIRFSNETLDGMLDFYKSTDIINDVELVGTYEIYTRIYNVYKCK